MARLPSSKARNLISTSKKVFDLRKAGQLDEAYRLALSHNNASDSDIWDIRALGWCLVDLVDQAISQGNYQKLPTYRQQLEKIEVNTEEQRYTRDNALTPSEDAPLIARRIRALSLISQVESGQSDDSFGTIITYKDIYAKRKENIDQAYKMALQATNGNDSRELELHALAWCLIDIIKRDFKAGNYKNLDAYHQQLQGIAVDECRDEILSWQKDYALSMCEPSAPIIFQAHEFSKQEKYSEAINCYNKLYPNIPQKYLVNFGWDLYRYSIQLLKNGQHEIPQIKRNLFQYLKLDVEKPSLLHSLVLQLAKKISKFNKLDLTEFLHFWGLENFRYEDFEKKQSKDGRVYPALVEDVVQRSIKSAVHSKNIDQVKYLFPFLEDCIKKYPDNEWLEFYKAKALILLGRNEEAQKYCIAVCKRKTSEFWAWMLLGDSYGNNRESALACYAKALLCPAEKDKTINLRIKTAQCLAELGYKEQSKLELSVCQRLKPESLPKEAISLMSQNWFQEAVASTSNIDFYATYAAKAEELLLVDIPWIDAVVGEIFTINSNENRKIQVRRRVYLKADPFPREISCPVKIFPYPDLPPGSPIRVKGEELQGRPYKILAISKRDCNMSWDIFSSRIGIITFVNRSKRIYRLLIDRDIECFFNFDKIDYNLDEYNFVEGKIAIFIDDKGKKYNVIDAKKTEDKPNENIYKEFSNESVMISGEIGFTESKIFIPPDLVKNNSITEDNIVDGKAILAYDKKKGKWGWKAIEVTPYTLNDENDSEFDVLL